MQSKTRFIVFPGLKVWKEASSTAFGTRSKDPILTRMDDLVSLLEGFKDQSEWLMCDLYFVTDYWLRHQPTNPLMEAGRRSAVQGLFERTVQSLCAQFKCGINGLPRELQLAFGTEITAHGHTVDNISKAADKLGPQDLALRRLWFKDGLAYQWDWWNQPNPQLAKRVLADSANSTFSQFLPGWTGFAMTTSRDIYVTTHRYTANRKPEELNFYHTSYLGGAPVACCGSLLIERGVIAAVKTDSGHYKPHFAQVMNLVSALRMWNASTFRLRIYNFAEELANNGGQPAAPGALMVGSDLCDYERAHGNWLALLANRKAELKKSQTNQLHTRQVQAWVRRLKAGIDQQLYVTAYDFIRDWAFGEAPANAVGRMPQSFLGGDASHWNGTGYGWFNDCLDTLKTMAVSQFHAPKFNNKSGACSKVMLSKFGLLPPWAQCRRAYPAPNSARDRLFEIGRGDDRNWEECAGVVYPQNVNNLYPVVG
jgi:hypothetical protein